MAAVLYPGEKTAAFNLLHGWRLAGIEGGGLLMLLLLEPLQLSWKTHIMAIPIPGPDFGGWAPMPQFPRAQSSDMGVPFRERMTEALQRPKLWTFPVIMFVTASAELAPGFGGDIALSKPVAVRGLPMFVYVSAIMFTMRYFVGALQRRFSDIGLRWACTIPAALGLYGLYLATSPLTGIAAKTLWTFGVCFMWPAMLAATARHLPGNGAWAIGIIGFAGATIYFVLRQIGKFYDRAKLASAGGADAFAALQVGPQPQPVVPFAAEQSFPSIALVPVPLFAIFGRVWICERRRKEISR